MPATAWPLDLAQLRTRDTIWRDDSHYHRTHAGHFLVEAPQKQILRERSPETLTAEN
jgi:hypothetical protein